MRNNSNGKCHFPFSALCSAVRPIADVADPQQQSLTGITSRRAAGKSGDTEKYAENAWNASPNTQSQSVPKKLSTNI